VRGLVNVEIAREPMDSIRGGRRPRVRAPRIHERLGPWYPEGFAEALTLTTPLRTWRSRSPPYAPVQRWSQVPTSSATPAAGPNSKRAPSTGRTRTPNATIGRSSFRPTARHTPWNRAWPNHPRLTMIVDHLDLSQSPVSRTSGPTFPAHSMRSGQSGWCGQRFHKHVAYLTREASRGESSRSSIAIAW